MNTLQKAKTELLESTVYNMMTESTGRALGDSGHYGRHWERNEKKSLEDFKNEPPVDFSNYEIEKARENGDTTIESDMLDFTVSIFHYLAGTKKDPAHSLQIDELCEEYNSRHLPADNWDSEFYGVSAEAYEWLQISGFRLDEPENMNHSAPHSFNTYNGNWLGSQTLQGTIIEHGNGYHYVLLQLHNGADVRGGYTDARLFRLEDAALPFMDVFTSVEDDTGNVIEVNTLYDGWSLKNDNGAGIDVPIENFEDLKDNARLY